MISAKEKLVANYRELATSIESRKKDLISQGFTSTQVAIIRRTLENRIAYLNYFMAWKQDGDWNKRWAARDSMMAANIIWFAQEIFPEK